MREIHPQELSGRQSSAPTTSELAAELRAQRKLLEQNNSVIRSVQRILRFSAAFSLFRTLLLLIPLILGLIYLPPLLRGAMESWQEVLEGSGSSLELPKGLDIKSLQELLQRPSLLER